MFIKKRLPHAHHQFNKTPFEAITGRKPNIKNIKVFGSRVIAKNTGTRRAKLDDNTSRGIFLHHTGTTSISKYLDTTTNREKTSSHLEYDEAHYTTSHKPIGALALLNQGYHHSSPAFNANATIDENSTTASLLVQKLSENAKLPVRSTDGAAGMDLFRAEPCTIKPGEIKLIKTDISIACPDGTYGRIAPRSGLTVKRQLDVRAGVIDADYRGNIQVAMHNIGTQIRELPTGTKIAQLILEQISNVDIVETNTLPDTHRGTQGFGSTDNNTTSPPNTVNDDPDHIIPTNVATPKITPIPNTDINIIECEPNELQTPTINSFSSPLEDLYLSCDPFGPTTTVTIKVTGIHPTLGLELEHQANNGRLLLRNCAKGTPAHKIKKWRSTLRGGNLLSINTKPVSNLDEIKHHIETARQQKQSTLSLTFATEERIPVHIESGTPQIFFDQLNALAAYL